MKRVVISLLWGCFCVLSICAQSQPVSQDVRIPKYTKILEVQSKNVNVRQQPSVSSPKIECDSPEFLLVIDETPEWYHAAILTNGKGDGIVVSQPGYVSKKVCRVREVKTLNYDYARSVLNEADFTYNILQTGKYKGYVIVTYREYYAADDHSHMFIGKMYGNMCVGVHMGFQYDYSPDQVVFGLGWDEVREELITMNVPMARIFNKNKSEYDWSGLTDKEIDRLFSTQSKGIMDILLPGAVRYSYRNGDGASGNGVLNYRFDSAKYQGELTDGNTKGQD